MLDDVHPDVREAALDTLTALHVHCGQQLLVRHDLLFLNNIKQKSEGMLIGYAQSKEHSTISFS